MKIHTYIATGALCFSLTSFGVEFEFPSYKHLLNKFCEKKNTILQKVYPYNPLCQANRKKIYTASEDFLLQYTVYKEHIKPLKQNVTLAFTAWKNSVYKRWQERKEKNNNS